MGGNTSLQPHAASARSPTSRGSPYGQWTPGGIGQPRAMSNPPQMAQSPGGQPFDPTMLSVLRPPPQTLMSLFQGLYQNDFGSQPGKRQY